MGALEIASSTTVERFEPADPLIPAVGAWLLTLRSNHSRAAYAIDLGYRYHHDTSGNYQLVRRRGQHAWLDYLEHLGVAVDRADEVHVNAWRDHLAEQAGYQPATIARKMAAVSSFYGYLVRRRAMAANPAALATRVDIDRSRTVTFCPDPGQLGPLLVAAQDRDPRTSALVHLLLLTGVRISEALGADLEDLRTENDMTLVRVVRKGGKVQDVPVPDPAVQALRTYVGSRTSGPVFLSESGTRLSPRRAAALVRSVGVRSGVSDRLSPHSLRHGYATGAEDAKVPVTQIQHDLGHRSLTTTQGYLHAAGAHKRFGGHRLAAKLAKRRQGGTSGA
jgi:integrase/recombinase XerD